MKVGCRLSAVGCRVSLAALLVSSSFSSGCDSAKTSGSDEVTIVVQGDRRELELQEKSIKDREAALRAESEKLDQRRAELEKIRLASDAEQRRRLDEEMSKLRTQQGEVAVQVTAVEAQKSEVLAKRSAIEAPAMKVALSELSAREAGVASREARMAERELDVARREKELGSRERTLGGREADQNGRDRALAAREEQLVALEKNNTAQAQHLDRALREVPKPGAVESRHKKVLDELEARGVLIGDLPLEDQPLNAEIWNARRQGDFARAQDLVAELAKTVKHLKVDQRFVEAKMVRLQAMRASARLQGPQRAEVERLLREVTGAYSDGKYEVANKGLNRIAAILDAGPSSG
jgi:hypothetical protein